MTKAFAAHFGDKADEIPQQTVSEDFGKIPEPQRPVLLLGLGSPISRHTCAAEKAGNLDDLTTNHSPAFLPPIQPTLRTGTEALDRGRAGLARALTLPPTDGNPQCDPGTR